MDSYTEVRSPVGPKTDFVKAEYQDMRRLSEFAATSTAATALIHHASKAIRLDPFDAMAGSFAVAFPPLSKSSTSLNAMPQRVPPNRL